LIQTWLILGDLVGGIAARLAGIKKIIWNVRYSFLEIKYEKIRNILIIKALAILSYIIPEYIIVVSKSAKYYCENLGYCKKKLHLIRNGYELNQFYPSKIKRVAFRKKFKIKKKIPLIGYVARFHPQKNHTYLLNALSQLNSKNVDFFCVLAGSQINKKNKELILQINKLNLSNKIILLDHYKNIPQLMNALDIHVICSLTEGFSNVLAETMACGIPNITTNCGDASLVVGKTGWLITSKNSNKLASSLMYAMSQLRTQNWKKRCSQARLRISKNFDISKMVESYNKLWKKVYNLN
jgi:glycosyltransferase involved in cell wall biosynthesis